MITFPLPLAALLDQRVRRELDLLYGPGWRIRVNGVVEIMSTDWDAMTETEREQGRERITELWREKGWMVRK